MKIKKEETRVDTYNITVGFICDKCGKEVLIDNKPKGVTEEFILERQTGTHGVGRGNEGGCTEYNYVNLCNSCVDWLFSKLQEFGVNINTEESDW